MTRSELLLHVLEIGGEVERRPQLDDAVDALELAEGEGTVGRRVVVAEELGGGADEAVRGGHDERGHRRPRHPQVRHHPVLDTLQQPIRHNLHASEAAMGACVRQNSTQSQGIHLDRNRDLNHERSNS